MIARRVYMANFAGAMILAAGLGLMATGACGKDSAPFMAGDLIVKFFDSSASGAAVARAVRGEKTAKEGLAAIATRLSGEFGVALNASSVTSGRELVLTIERDKLIQDLRQRLVRDPAVRAATPVPPPKTVLPAARIALTVELVPDSDAQRQVLQAARAGRETGGEIEKLIAGFSAGGYPKFAGHVSTQGQLVLTVDIATLTRELVARLQRARDVEYVQVSHVVRPY